MVQIQRFSRCASAFIASSTPLHPFFRALIEVQPSQSIFGPNDIIRFLLGVEAEIIPSIPVSIFDLNELPVDNAYPLLFQNALSSIGCKY